MSILIGNYRFEGPYTSTTKIEDKPGIYAIHCYHKNEYQLIDLGEAAQLRARIESHERMKCWQKNCPGYFAVSVFYTPHWTQMGRMELQQKLRKIYNPPCGKKLDGMLNFLK